MRDYTVITLNSKPWYKNKYEITMDSDSNTKVMRENKATRNMKKY